jgi:YHS domain-containing protein
MPHPDKHRALLRRTLARLLVAGAIAALLAGCGAMLAQNPDSPLKPVRAVAMDGDDHVMLTGHDMVAYFTLGRHAPGLAQFKSVHQGVTFRFMSAEHKALFDADPARYLPQYGGYCASGISYAIPWGGDADTWRIIDGKLYIFGGPTSRASFELDTARNIALADRYWREEVAGRNSFVQRTWRLVNRVPHYKSDAQLAADVAAAQGRKTP